MAAPVPVLFVGGPTGPWQIERIQPVTGQPLPPAACLAVFETRTADAVSASSFVLRGSTGHVRYVEQSEKAALAAVTPPLSRPQATCAALIPIRKSDAWWELPQDERRAILEQRSRHMTRGLAYLPAVARRLYHARELGEPFDFLTWFEYAPEHAARFEELVSELRATEEWRYVEREVDVRLQRQA
jgi:chlorite dismutase